MSAREEVLFQIPPSRRRKASPVGFQVATPSTIEDKRAELEDFVRRLFTTARAWSQANVNGYAETWEQARQAVPASVPQNWLTRAKIRVVPIDDGVVADDKAIDLYYRWGLIKQKLRGDRCRRPLVLRRDRQGAGAASK